MYKPSLSQLFALFLFGFNCGLKRSTIVSNKILKEWFDEWVDEHLANNPPKIKERAVYE